MLEMLAVIAATGIARWFWLGAIVFIAVLTSLATAFLLKYGALWLQAYMCGADVTLRELVGMILRQVEPSLVVKGKVMGQQAGLSVDRLSGMTTAGLEAHYLAGGDVMTVMQAIIAADRAGIDLDFDRAAAIDLAGRDVLDSVRTSVSPKVIDCPAQSNCYPATLSAVARNGVELLIRARVTVRTNLEQLIGGATEQTIIARVGQGIITAVGSADSHMDVMETPDRISKGVMERGLDTNTAFAIISIDIADVDVGEHIGARLRTDQAAADTRVAQARAEGRRAAAIALEQEMQALIQQSRGKLILAEAELPKALAAAVRSGRLRIQEPQRRQSANFAGIGHRRGHLGCINRRD